MARPGIRNTEPSEERDRDQSTAGDDARRRLLAGLPVREQVLNLAGVSTAVLEGGDGPPVILLHGPGEYAAKWFRVIPALAATHRVVAPDLPGHGASGAFDQVPDADRLFSWLESLIVSTCAEPPTLVGQILGGAIAARFAAARGNRVGRLVLADTLGLAPFQPAPEFGEALMGFLSEPTGEAHDHLWTQCAFDLDTLRRGLGERWEWLRAYNLDRAGQPALRAASGALMERFGMPAIPEEDLAQISVPTTLIWGRHDLATRLPVAEAAGSKYGWPLHVIENAADDPPLEQPEAFLAVLRSVMGE